jgi:hypothetical protein
VTIFFSDNFLIEHFTRVMVVLVINLNGAFGDELPVHYPGDTVEGRC